MATISRLFQNTWAVFWVLMVFSASQAQASFVSASSDMTVNNLNFSLGSADSQLQWTDVWQGIVTAHAADSDSAPADQSNAILSNNDTIQAQADTAHVHSLAAYTVVNGDQIGLSPDAGVSGTTHSDLFLSGPGKQADGFAESTFNNLFMITNPNDPNAQGPVNVTFNLKYSGVIFGAADAQGFFQNITDIAILQLFDLSGNLLNYDVFQNSISGTDTTILQPDHGTLSVSYLLDYNTNYLVSATADSEIYGYTIPTPATLPLILLGFAVLRQFRSC